VFRIAENKYKSRNLSKEDERGAGEICLAYIWQNQHENNISRLCIAIKRLYNDKERQHLTSIMCEISVVIIFPRDETRMG
jgi:hypothetical protein